MRAAPTGCGSGRFDRVFAEPTCRETLGKRLPFKVAPKVAGTAAIEVPTMDDSQLFMVRVWPPKPGFRASARRVDSDEPQLLNSPQELADYFARASGAPPPPPHLEELQADLMAVSGCSERCRGRM